MQIGNIRGRSAAILLSAVLASGGVSLLFSDVIVGAAPFTAKHFQTICILLGTTIASLVAAAAWEHRHTLACIGFIGIAAAGTFVIVWYSLGRQVEGQLLSSEDHDKAAEQRSRLKTQLEAEEKARTAKRIDADAVCKKLGPEHKRCLGARAVETVYADSVAGLEARLTALKVKPADPSAEAFGKLASALGFNADKAKALALLLMPYTITALFELGLAMSLHYAFRPGHSMPARLVADRPELPALPAPTQLATVSDAERFVLRQQFAAEQPNGSGRDGGSPVPNRKPNHGPKSNGSRFSKETAAADLVTRLALGEQFGSQDELRARYGVAKSTISEWLREFEADGLIPARTSRGRCKVLVAAD